jgi:DNA-binding NtrC family response regulator
MMCKTILIAEDEKLLRESLAEILTEEGYRVKQASNGKEAYDLVVKESFDLVLSDVRMPEMDGIELLEKLRQLAPQTPVVILTAFGTVNSAVQAMQAGAADYLLKPVQFDDVLLRIERALKFGEMVRTSDVMTEQLAAPSSFHSLIGESEVMTRLYDLLRKLSQVKSSVLVLGESGTGKELIAKAVHYNGVTRDKPFVPVNCGAIPESLIESELFGHRKGAFTGAIHDRVGYFEAANGGTIFLDEISSLPLHVQATLLRVLEERVVVPVGDTRPRSIDVRVVAASNQDLGTLCKEGTFREDLLYRLDVVRVDLPPLRHRRQDVPLLAHYFLGKYAKQMGKKTPDMTNGAVRALLNHDWPGNVRELENVIERAVIFADNRPVSVEDLPITIDTQSDDVDEDLKEAIRQFERQHIIHSLKRHDYDKAETAKQLGIGVSSLYRKLDELKIDKAPASRTCETETAAS